MISSAPVSIRCKGILFDLDGILISSLDSVERSWSRWAKMRGVDPAQTCKTAHGCRAIETIAKMRPDLDCLAELRVIDEIEFEDCEGITVLPGVEQVLSALPKERWVVVTSATERVARARLASGGIAAPARFIHAESVTQGKPHPAPYLAGAALLGYKPEDCVVVEDAASGVKAGRAAGCTMVATTFSHSVESLNAAHYLIPNMTGVEVKTLAGAEGLVLRFTPLSR